MRWLAAVLLLGPLVAGEVPTLTRPDGPLALTYDLGATAPWMPLLWERCLLTLPAGTTQCQVSVTLKAGADGSDLLTLREGHGLSLTATTLIVAGIAGTWSGVRSFATPTSLTATLNAAPGHTLDAASVLLLCRQLHYANLGGVRALAVRQVGITLLANGVNQSAEVLIGINEAVTDQPPKLRFDNLSVALGASTPVPLLGWYDGRQPASQLTCRIAALPSGVTLNAQALPMPTLLGLVDFEATLPLLRGSALLAPAACIVAFSDGVNLDSVAFNLAVTAPIGDLEVVGDIPFLVGQPTTVTLHASRADISLVNVLAHPGGGGVPPAGERFTTTLHGADIDVLINPGATTGCLEFVCPDGSFRLPYRVMLPGAPN